MSKLEDKLLASVNKLDKKKVEPKKPAETNKKVAVKESLPKKTSPVKKKITKKTSDKASSSSPTVIPSERVWPD